MRRAPKGPRGKTAFGMRARSKASTQNALRTKEPWLPIASLAAFLLWLIEGAAERAGIHRRLHPGNGKRRVFSRVFLARLLLVLDSTRDVLDELLATIASPEQWFANDDRGLLADGAGGDEFVGIPQGTSRFSSPAS